MTSWILRLSNANGTSVMRFLSSYLENQAWEKSDLDMLEENDMSILAQVSKVQNKFLLRKMTLSHVREPLILTGRVNRKTWLSSVFNIRYCPVCLQEDKIPYYRLLWRLHFLPICIEHGVLLQQVRRNCAPRLNDIIPANPKTFRRVFSFSYVIQNIIDKQEIQRVFDFPFPPKQFFGTLLLFALFFAEYLPREREWNAVKELYDASPNAFYYLWRMNSKFACIVLEKSLAALEEWSEAENFILHNKSSFRKLCRRYEYVPDCIALLIYKKL